ncbi:MAG: hypothetical protein V3U03_17485 [Myxococcota bacterium]
MKWEATLVVGRLELEVDLDARDEKTAQAYAARFGREIPPRPRPSPAPPKPRTAGEPASGPRADQVSQVQSEQRTAETGSSDLPPAQERLRLQRLRLQRRDAELAQFRSMGGVFGLSIRSDESLIDAAHRWYLEFDRVRQDQRAEVLRLRRALVELNRATAGGVERHFAGLPIDIRPGHPSVEVHGGRDYDREGTPRYYFDADAKHPIGPSDWCSILDKLGAEAGEVLKVSIRRATEAPGEPASGPGTADHPEQPLGDDSCRDCGLGPVVRAGRCVGCWPTYLDSLPSLPSWTLCRDCEHPAEDHAVAGMGCTLPDCVCELRRHEIVGGRPPPDEPGEPASQAGGDQAPGVDREDSKPGDDEQGSEAIP